MAAREMVNETVDASHCPGHRARRESRPAGGPTVPEARRELLSAAVELGVDPEDVELQTEEERRLWEDLEREFQAFVTKIGPVWIAD